MKRKEEIIQAANSYKNYFPDGFINEFTYIDGAEWADRTMIERVCEWLEDNIYDYLYINRDFNEADYKNELMEDLRKAMGYEVQ